MTSRKCINALSAAFCLYVRRKTYALPFFESFRASACDKVSSKSSIIMVLQKHQLLLLSMQVFANTNLVIMMKLSLI